MRLCNTTRKPGSRIRYYLLPALLLLTVSLPATAARCLLVMSYHQGYAWNDGVERGVRNVIGEQCELRVFYMDTKRNKDADFARQKALEAKAIIETWKPDVVIATDDNASRYLVQPWYRDADTPFVFAAVNWTAKKYGYPYRNVTGMIEVAPIIPMLRTVSHVLPIHRHALYLGADTFTEQKNYQRFKDIYGQQGIQVDALFASTLAQWQQHYLKGQDYDFIILGSNAGINDWNAAEAARFALENAKVLTVSNHHWMSPYAMYSITKIPEEQGEWAAEIALAITRGMDPARIPIVPNRKWKIYINEGLARRAGISLPHHGGEVIINPVKEN
ncbi:MAG TPA: hypothetical protein ENJ01_01200 [Gammaproteobacteria bacterium]|nr:hypothetical protein [Gammaproteobacteria bacterium]